MIPSVTVIRDVSESLRNMIAAFIPELSVSTISFLSPGQIVGSKTMLSLFLYRLATDPFTVNQVPVIREKPDGSFEKVPPPQALNLNYIMVPFSPDPETELVIADRLRSLFYNMPSLKGPWLKQSLKDAGNQKISIVPKDPPMEKIHNIWMGFAHKPFRLSLFYDLVPTFIPAEIREQVVMVGDATLGNGEEG